MLIQSQEINPLYNNRAILNFSRIPNVDFFVKSFTVPGLSINVNENPTSIVPTRHPGTILNFESTMSIMFILDEDLNTYFEIYEWMTSIAPSHDRKKEIKDPENDFYSDMTIVVNSNQGTPIVKFHYMDCFPIGLSGLDFTASTASPSELTGDATFAYTRFRIERL
jgi:hypothetical protein